MNSIKTQPLGVGLKTQKVGLFIKLLKEYKFYKSFKAKYSMPVLKLP